MDIKYVETWDGSRYLASERMAEDVKTLPEPHRQKFADLFGIELSSIAAESTPEIKE